VSAVELFTYNDVEVRTVVSDDGPWFVAADVCAVLDIRNHRDALASLDDDEKGVATTDTPGGAQSVATVNEPGLYSLIFRSRKAEAKAFKRWVTHEVLPQIRRTGKYAEVPKTYAEALQAAADMARELESATERLAIDSPKADIYDRVIESDGMFSMTSLADMCNVSVNKFTGWLADAGVFRKGEYGLFPGRKLPRKAYQDQGLFDVKIEQNDKGIHYPVAYATPAGLDFTMNLLRENGLVD
jgi:anti-repressor protein